MDLLDDDTLLDLRRRARRTDPAAVTAEEQSERSEAPDSNADLQAWMADAGIDAVDGGRDPTPEGACHVCKANAAKYTCAHCHRGACAAHQWIMFGLCHRCATEERIRRWHARGRPETENWLDPGRGDEPGGDRVPGRDREGDGDGSDREARP